MNLQTLIFTDLDDTLFQSRKKCPTPEGLEPGASLLDGTIFSFSTPKQRALLENWLISGATVIPVTARTLASYKRVHIPFQSWAIIQHGGLIVNADFTIDSEWYSIMKESLTPFIALLHEAKHTVEQFAASWKIPVNVRITSEEGLDFYLLLKHQDKETTDLGEFGDALQEKMSYWPGFWQHRNGNNWAFLPEVVRKENALQFLLNRLILEKKEFLSIGVGDSTTDFPFMNLCDYALFPKKSQIAKAINEIKTI